MNYRFIKRATIYSYESIPNRKKIISLFMKQVFIFIFLLLSASFIYSQDKPGTSFSGSANGDAEVCPKSLNYLTPQDVNNLVTQMLEKLGTRNRYIIKSCSQIDNCQAILYKGKPFILYNPDFLNKVKRLNFSKANLPGADDKDWETLTILAHELGHHINNHLINPEPDATQREMELEADETAGFIIYLMGGSLMQAQLAYYNLNVSDKGDYEHPPRKQRLDIVSKGWNNAAKKYPKPVEIVVKDRDSDGDGVLDNVDRCPDTKGLVSLKGCPDRDGDGIADNDDYCPDVPGLERYRGCPIPDTDKDGINDEVDKCINVPGSASNFGCPVKYDVDVLDVLGADFVTLDPQKTKEYGVAGGVVVKKINVGVLNDQTRMKDGFVITKINEIVVKTVEDMKRVIGTNKNITIGGLYPGYDGLYEYPVSITN